MTTRLQALETEIASRMESLAILAAIAEMGSESAESEALEMIREIEELETEAAVERARA